MLNAYIYDGLRSPIGRHGGVLASIRPDDLAAEVIKKLIEKTGVPGTDIEDVILGDTNQAGEDSRNVARMAVLLAGLPVTVPGQTVNRLCASGLGAIIDSARAITCGEGELYIAGGVESMTRAPFVMGKAETAFSREAKIFDTTIGSRFPNKKITAQYGGHSMPETGDNVAVEFGVTREQADTFAAQSQAKYQQAKTEGFFEGEITPIEVSQGKKLPPKLVSEDEHPRPSSNFEALSKLKPLFEGGVVTAGNASGINDGAAALLIGSETVQEKYGLKPMAKILSAAAAGIEPRIMGAGPIEAIKKAVSRAGLTLDDMDIIEINEAFASQVLSCLKGLDVDFNDPRVNPNGGAIAVGHPLGASGARLTLTVARELQRRQKKYAVISLCIGVGQGLAMVIENVS
ncbi:3-oxoadipyl-CoA thiolase [Acinetobacter radioresistens]|jgi:acetyl-CoA C-acetyltransferase|uniref:acetyl-CoA C-acyltransferase n=1 Tax=Acinetobacter radioresistens SK82 TaxID=596318 RepID=A0ABM9YQP2_ACIRA|nr:MULTISPECIES: 3-oxoadipyl-CoA thiolase [Acinetobacter]EET83428.1 putative beta-ketoadipyl CoA thiolase [Acinetobacter radioresistens SK82]EEY87278.1 putative beta-ketoadipyl CoA thiolase [Acinetobacter radioresistens SH164]ENV87650.1 3-oxoadipyl-CoA thiolase [Acinetobacter radioresistens NIPH 2130]EXB81708.1 acetyl-CoA C-acetyltransferase family protein [Acinetobacter sp. 272263]EXE56307.1 acetyl-CoA C-acetyltransferase family protein [Acinetobacter sp. 1239920]